MATSTSRALLVSTAAILIALFTTACGGRRQVTAEFSPTDSAGQASQQSLAYEPRSLSVQEAVEEVSAAEVPAGVDPEIFELLRTELISALEARQASGTKLASAPPLHDYNEVDDLYVQEDQTSNSRLSWTYLNKGDYDQNGEVNVSDVTPIGLFFGKTAADPEWPQARLADGDGNGEVNISDISPLGQNYLAYTNDYKIYGSDATGGPWTMVDSCPLPAAQADNPVHCAFELASDSYEYYQVRPADSEGAEGTPSLPSTRLGATAKVTLGQTTWYEETSIGQAGGVVEGGSGGALEGFKVEFAMGSLDGETPIRLGLNDGSIIPVLGEFDGPILVLETGEQKGFTEPITITMPYERERWSERPIFFGFEDNGRLQLLNEGVISTAGAYMQMTTFKSLKYYAVLYASLSLLEQLKPKTTKYTPAYDGFQVVNKGTGLSPGGECFGFSAFSTWYYEGLDFDHSPQRMYWRFMYPVGYSGYTGQDIIASRAHTSVSRQWDMYWAFLVEPQVALPAALRYLTIATAIGNSGDPTIIYLKHANNSPGAHAVVGYAYDSTGIDIYDPNAPGDNTKRIPFNGITLGPYGSYDDIYYCAPGAFFVTEAFSPILADAEEGFNANGHGTMWFWSHEPMEEVYAGYVRLQGYVESVDLLVDEMWVGIGSAETLDYNTYKLPVASNGEMNFVVPITPGINIFFFDAFGTKINSPPKGYVPVDLVDCPDPYFRLVGKQDKAVISVILTWDKDDTDLDLVVVDPTGDYSWNVKPNTADGGELSIDDSDGYGPECWALRTNDVVRTGQPYRVRVHYYDDHDNGGTAFQVKVVLHEATGSQTTEWHPGFFLTSNQWSFDPVNDTGPEWRDVCTIVP